jgi:CubicO group peptidase (beta-lactamase class C family)
VAPSWLFGCGGLYSTVEDLYRWNEGIFNGRVLDAASLKAAFTPVKQSESQVNSDYGYGFGWFMTRDRGLRQILHSGGVPGFRSFLLRMPNEKFTVAVLANASPGQTNAIPGYLSRELEKIYLADKLAPLPIVNTNVSPKSYDALTGRYGLGGEIWTISKRGPHLFFQRGDQAEEVEVFPASETEFVWDGAYAQFTFVKDSSGKAVKLIIHQHGIEMDAPRAK